MSTQPDRGGVRRDGDFALIRIPMDEVHTFRVALQPVRVGETVSKSTQKFRDRIDKGLARLETQGR